MRLKMEIILLVKLYHPSNGSSFTSVSTYLQNKKSGCPSFTPWGVMVKSSPMGPITPLSFHREAVYSKESRASCHCNGDHLAWTFQREGNSTHSGPTCCLHQDGSFPNHVSVSTWWFKQCIPEIHSTKSHLERKYLTENDSLTPQGVWIIKQGKMEEEHDKNSPFHWIELFHSGKI